MNITPPLKFAAAAVLTLGFSSTSFAADMSAETTPQFSVKSNATRSIRSGASAFQNGDFAKSAVYSKRALKEGLSKSRKTTAYSNLCAALGAQGEYETALEACNSALEIAPQNWQALSNRASVNWLSGNTDLVSADITKAQELASDAPEIAHNVKVFG